MRSERELEASISRLYEVDGHTDAIGNIQIIAVIIKDIEEPSMRNARNIVETGGFGLGQYDLTSNQPEEVFLPSPINSNPQPAAPNPVNGGVQSNGTQNRHEFAESSRSPHNTVIEENGEPRNIPSPTMTGALIRLRNKGKRSIYHDYGDGGREVYDLDSSDDEHSADPNPRMGYYHPMPPFDPVDLRNLEKRKLGRQRTSSTAS